MKKLIGATVLIWAILSFQSCGKEEIKYTIPQTRVYLRVNLNAIDNALNSVLGYKTYTEADRPNYGSAAYFGYAGLLLFTYSMDEYALPQINAFDLCCPNEGQRSIMVAPNSEGKATCSTCKSVYDLTTGRPISGPSEKRLQSYSIIRSSPYNGVFTVQN